MSRPDSSEYATSYGSYVALVPEEDVVTGMETDLEETLSFLSRVSEQEACRRHPPYTWSVKEVIGHIIDSERVFGYRALRFARDDSTPLPGFDENAYAKAAEFDQRSLRDLAAEFENLRRSHLYFFRSLPDAAWTRHGLANGAAMTVRALAYIILGHQRHHVRILHQRLSSG
jgi:hypothetical protein